MWSRPVGDGGKRVTIIHAPGYLVVVVGVNGFDGHGLLLYN